VVFLHIFCGTVSVLITLIFGITLVDAKINSYTQGYRYFYKKNVRLLLNKGRYFNPLKTDGTPLIYMKLYTLFFLSILISFIPATTMAVVLNPVADVSITKTSIVKKDTGIFAISFTIKNNSRIPIDGIKYGVRIQNRKGDIVYTKVYDTRTTLTPLTPKKGRLEFTFPESKDGDYTIFVLAKNTAGVTTAVAFVKTIQVKQTTRQLNAKTQARLEKCTIKDVNIPDFVCTVTDTGNILSWSVFEGNAFGKKFASGTIKVIKKEISINLAQKVKKSGRYTVVFELQDSKGTAISLQRDVTFVVPGVWMVIKDSTQDIYSDNKLRTRIYLDGVGDSDNRGFKYWILDTTGATCASGEISLKQQIPHKRTIWEKLNVGCKNPKLVGFLYDGKNRDGTYNVLGVVGGISAKTLIAKKGNSESVSGTNVSQKNSIYFLIGLFLLTALLILFYGMWKRNKSSAVILGAILLFGFGGSGGVVHASTFLSADQNNVNFTVNLNKVKYGINENVTFSFGFVDSNTNLKPIGGTVQVQVDNGAFTPIVTSSDTATLYNISLPPIPTGGIHALNFEAPGLCGSAFGFSSFGSSLFGSDKCTFSVNVNIYKSFPPAFPQLSGGCVVGANNKYDFSSTDVGNNQVYYNVDFNANGSNINRVPTSGFMSPWPTVATVFYNGWTTKGNYTINLRATDQYQASLGWKSYPMSCCTLPTVCDGGSTNVNFYAKPAIILKGTSSTLYWNLKNVSTCSIAGSNNDSWNWGTVGSITNTKTSVMNEETTYTLSCTDFNGKKTTKSTKVRIVPYWEQI